MPPSKNKFISRIIIVSSVIVVIIAIGMVVTKNISSKTTQVTSITNTPTITPDTTLVYSGTTYPISLHYPKTWHVDTSQNKNGTILFVGPPPPRPETMELYSLELTKITTTDSIPAYLASLQKQQDENKAQGAPNFKIGAPKNITINGAYGYKITDQHFGVDANEADWYFFQHKGAIYQLSVDLAGGNGDIYDLKPYIASANTIVSSFRFTN